jgi:hypothetical protein
LAVYRTRVDHCFGANEAVQYRVRLSSGLPAHVVNCLCYAGGRPAARGPMRRSFLVTVM